MADKNMANFLATDKVPDTIFGIPVVSRREDYTEADLEFFREHPEAGGYYDMGEDSEPNDSDGVAASKGGDSFIERARRRIGEAGEVADYGLAWIERQHKQVADMKIPVVSKLTEAVLQPAVLGARAAVANLTSGGGKYYQPEVRDERYFSNDALKDLGTTLKYMRGRTSGRSDGMDSAAKFNLTQTLGGFSVKNKAVTDTFDINKSYQVVPQPLTDVARAVLGKQEDPDAGKVRTEVPLSKIPGANGVQIGGDSSDDLRDLWNRAVKSTGNLDGMARMFAAMAGESSLSQRGATAEQISNGHLARLIVHANETDRYNKNPANHHKRTVLDTTNSTSHVLSKYKWGTGPGANWFDSSKMEPRFDLISSDPVAAKTTRSLIMNVARFLNGDLKGKDWLPSDAISYGDGPKGLMPDREEIKPEENRIGPMPRGFRIGRKKGAK